VKAIKVAGSIIGGIWWVKSEVDQPHGRLEVKVAAFATQLELAAPGHLHNAG
jgi:hypothetical protein